MDVSFLGGPQPQRGVGIVAPFDFALDRELWRWVPDDVSLHLTRTPFVPVEVSLDLARLVSEHETLREAVNALGAVAPEVLAYACTSGSFVGGTAGERAMSVAMESAGEAPALTTSGALLEALEELGVRRVAVVTPYTKSVTDSLEDFLGEAGIAVTGRSYLGLTREIWRVPYRDVVGMAREAVADDQPDALFISCTNLPTYDVIPQLEAELRMPVVSANQVTVWAALRRIGKDAVGAYQALLDPVARRGPAAMTPTAAEPAVAEGDPVVRETVFEPVAEELPGAAVTEEEPAEPVLPSPATAAAPSPADPVLDGHEAEAQPWYDEWGRGPQPPV
ncbi:decarboxylase [Streptomyces sp. DSM 42041]|uniref:Decarboxylase n=1 Tax=Streptomyces hazeniae TaxID=3075538 RepID=A0ABU2NM33_9ACTN|nr:decarboxylase [Streptomyces sp. DSM 42041]MDT0377800.1 decarboxylase [Streptomyces sp. DSM 42041]